MNGGIPLGKRTSRQVGTLGVGGWGRWQEGDLEVYRFGECIEVRSIAHGKHLPEGDAGTV